ncbi:hypothetical protein A3H10_04585 [Candidatus Uhrbacteria bacterium RIFCSPLOWO2_12_FULL_46_10]|uniref:DUF218 domain-containing protein n=1 Tax=Candidatus Uhrbacteria bacterium RIFCSPLOWO2_01_FULL_47_25 TaxID=1802402 RepID=A0A1F7UW28_9BACT|nr:MAG: hypothetical protein UX68_C0006G0022 [Parcubacteria group bacterium GW2011_GWA2_46_9]OGL59374.1 MAG: hypothetical protein A2752_05450 [Candidatus Uhrbacteria bacterium RIFCSPHIGHO2_01_FULL_46_23]OGL69009.1 MAG: hypothetical protein A3D60_04505 [Candidatus Uhrbacteria bacterium RIFCSPHIGHO2_02_FULL_47_29]OGL75944.1 MAG: hypothetical protein A3E96_03760 [Candidatus Uhrbacteria bacterium RIFCSPHIGHO2_12_FULL_46_13]OGL82480.1 MAG: hypothetical protein A2936_02375 [Candidatus Uhrbacteria bac
MNLKTIKAIEDFLLVKSDKIQKASLAFVFGSLSLESSKYVAALFKSGYCSYVLVSGGKHLELQGKTEAAYHQRYLIKSGVPENRIILESRARNTLENVIFSRKVILRYFHRIPAKIIVIGQPFHGRRILMTLRKNLSARTKYIVQLVPTKSHRVNNWWHDKKLRAHVIDEIRKIGEYAQRGHLTWR